jgi:histidinol-phosphate/aromatic aminotransferase/cobyric acid decarboxylase-like protein
MAGLRVGYTVSTPAIAALLEKLRPPYNLSSVDQCAAEFDSGNCRAFTLAVAQGIRALPGLPP